MLVLLLGFTITRPIKRLSLAAAQMKEGNFDITVNEKGHDELSTLTHTFNEMAQSVNERLVMLKYISPHTIEMVGKLIKNEISDKGETKYVAILFSDMRGFTKFSEHKKPEEVVAVLNKLFDFQSKIIERYNGKIDKHVGDQVVAIARVGRDIISA